MFRAVLIEDSRGALVTGNELPKVKEAKVKSPKRGNKRNMDDLELDNIYGSSSVIDISKVKHQETSVFVAKATKKSNNTKKWCFVYKDNGALEVSFVLFCSFHSVRSTPFQSFAFIFKCHHSVCCQL